MKNINIEFAVAPITVWIELLFSFAIEHHSLSPGNIHPAIWITMGYSIPPPRGLLVFPLYQLLLLSLYVYLSHRARSSSGPHGPVGQGFRDEEGSNSETKDSSWCIDTLIVQNRIAKSRPHLQNGIRCESKKQRNTREN